MVTVIAAERPYTKQPDCFFYYYIRALIRQALGNYSANHGIRLAHELGKTFLGVVAMKLTIFLDIEEVFRLSQLVPFTSPASKAIARAIHMREYWGSGGPDVAVECDDGEGRDLLGYAEPYPSAANKIRRAFRLAQVRIDDSDHSLLTAFSKSERTWPR